MKRLMLFGLLAGLLASNTGCGLCHSILCYRPCRGFGGGGDCVAPCDDGCGPACGVGRGCGLRCGGRGCDDCNSGYEVGGPRLGGRGCGPCGDPCGDPCAAACGRVWYRGPISCVFALFSPRTWCGPSCGERYWGDFYSDPPDCWDPCDCHGNYTGGGNPYAGGYGGSGGQGVFDAYRDDGVSEGNVVSDRAVGPAPTPAPQPRKATRQ